MCHYIWKLPYIFLVTFEDSSLTVCRDKRKRISTVYPANRAADINEIHVDRDYRVALHILRHAEAPRFFFSCRPKVAPVSLTRIHATAVNLSMCPYLLHTRKRFRNDLWSEQSSCVQGWSFSLGRKIVSATYHWQYRERRMDLQLAKRVNDSNEWEVEWSYIYHPTPHVSRKYNQHLYRCKFRKNY